MHPKNHVLSDDELEHLKTLFKCQAMILDAHLPMHEASPCITRFEHVYQKRPWTERLAYGSTHKRRKMIESILQKPLNLSGMLAASQHETVKMSRDWKHSKAFFPAVGRNHVNFLGFCHDASRLDNKNTSKSTAVQQKVFHGKCSLAQVRCFVNYCRDCKIMASKTIIS
jgi:hypothetical protein